MPKPMFVWSGSAWVSVATEVESLAGFATQSYADNTPGMRLVVPTSVAVGSGSGSVNAAGQVTFTGVSSVSLNGVFSSTYDNYLILIKSTDSVGSGQMFMRMRVSGSDNTNNEYTRFGFYADQTNATGGMEGSAGTSSFIVSEIQGTDGSQAIVNLQSPFLNELTKFNGQTTKKLNLAIRGGSTTTGVTTSYTGFTLFHSQTSMTGTVSVYGYKD
jgi:hypothetical protein